MQDILFKTDDAIFSYRVAGICVRDGRVLLQKPTNDDGYAFPGGHVAFGETHETTLVREFAEEMGASVKVGELKWVGEVFILWGNRRCHQICLYYMVEITDEAFPTDDKFLGREQFEERNFDMEFYWIPIDELENITLYPTNCKDLMRNLDSGVAHFVYKET